MALQKQAIPLNFAQGLDTKSDRKQVELGKFLMLRNSVFTKAGMLQKRNGYGYLTALPDTTFNYLTTFQGNLTAIGDKLEALVAGAKQWVNKGSLQPIDLNTLPLIRSNTNQSQSDTAISTNNLVCTVYTDVQTAGTVYRYAIADSVTGQNVVAPRAIPVTSGTVTGSPKVFLLGRYFIIVFNNVITGVPHLQYVAIPVANPSSVSTNVNISSTYVPSSTLAFDGVVVGSKLFMGWNDTGAVKVTYLSSALVLQAPFSYVGEVATIMSLSADVTNPSSPVIYLAYYDSGSSTGYVFCVDQNLNRITTRALILSAVTALNITSAAQNGVCTVFYELSVASAGPVNPVHIIAYKTVTQNGTVSSQTTTARGVGLASKAFIINSVIYVLSIFSTTFQPTYFLLTKAGLVVTKFAYQNAGPYYITGLPSVTTVDDSTAQISYLFKDLVEAVNKTQGNASPAGVYSQLGINLVTLTFDANSTSTAEIGGNLNLSGGFLWGYDGYVPVESGFFLYPENNVVSISSSGGAMENLQYFYQITYEWADNQGNVFRSAPSVPEEANLTGGSANANSVTLKISTLRLTYKTANPVKIVIYRWSTNQQTYYQVTSITAPTMNSTTVDYITYTDTLADSSIIGNNILYTTGGVLENTGVSAAKAVTLFNNRLFYISSEDRNLLGFSKQVIEATPVETSDLLTIFVAPTIGAQGSTGSLETFAPMDDKLILFKRDAMLYINGNGPDSTGANSQYSEPQLITATVGCSNQRSIVFTPNGLMFQSDKGIWLLGRDLNTTYIGAPVEAYTDVATVTSAICVPGTNQVRFTMSSGITLMYDYYYGQWGTFINVPAVSSTLYNNLHTSIDSFGRLLQETPGVYLDGAAPVLMSFSTSWVSMAGLQGYQRSYFFYLLAEYLSPHKLIVQVAYDYNPSIALTKIIDPKIASPLYGGDSLWGGGSPWGGPENIEQWRVFLDRQRCESFQITVSEQFDPTPGQVAGAGFVMSGINMVVGVKKGYLPIRSARSI